MNSLSPNSTPRPILSSLNSHSLRPSQFSSSLFSHSSHRNKQKPNLRELRKGVCRAELSHDAPFVVAIGACMLSSLVLPAAVGVDEDGSAGIVSTDTRFAAMGVISFIPYFNWLSWVFAWLDSGKKRYAAYALVYLAPYFRSNLSLSPEESWLPIASIIFCIVHVQLEASIRNGDIQGFQIFSEATKHSHSMTRKNNFTFKSHQENSEGEKSDHMKLPSTQGDDEVPWWSGSEKPKDPQQRKNDWQGDDQGRKP